MGHTRQQTISSPAHKTNAALDQYVVSVAFKIHRHHENFRIWDDHHVSPVYHISLEHEIYTYAGDFFFMYKCKGV